jgi:Rad3-related DNA helicase
MTATDSIFESLTPADLGLPPKFVSFRLPQRQALEWLTEQCEHQVSAASIPTGVGKTSLAVAYTRLLGVKAVYLVATKALEAQVLADFSSMGMVNVHGRANYTCPNYGDCDKGVDQSCSLAQTESCPYSHQVGLAADSDLVVTNYAYYLWSKGVRNKAFADTGLLICDEAHALEHQLGSFASVKLYARELRGSHEARPNGVFTEGSDNWKTWAMDASAKLASKGDVRELDEDEADLLDRLRRVTRMHSNWVWQFDDRGHVSFEPIRLAAYTRGLFAGVPRVFMMSASLSEFVMKLLMPSDTRYDYRSWPPVFPQQNSPVYHIPTVKLSWKSTDEDYRQVIEQADRIISGRLDRKGILHTVSYARARRALSTSAHKDRFVWNEDGSGLGAALDRFRTSESGSVLVTPSVEEGFDFPGGSCEYQIVLKFPFPNETQRVVKERCAQIPGYRLHHAAQKIVQMRGRAVRSEDDRAELFLLDNAVKQLCGPEGRSYCPPGFRIFTVNKVPPAPPKIQPNN